MLVDIPTAIAARPKDRDGHLIPFYAVVVDLILPIRLDGQKVTQACRQRLCGVCGTPLSYWIVFLGGAGNRTSRRFPHPPMHKECAEHLLAHDPFWSIPEVERTRAWEKEAETLGLCGSLDFVLYITRGFEFNHRTRMFQAHAPKEG